MTPVERFWSKVEKTDTCWLWLGNLNDDGYGRYNGQLAHRRSYELMVGPIPPGMEIDHRCFNHACVRPDHLRLATHKQNQENRAPRGVRGVCWDSRRQKFVVQVTHNYRNHYGGGYASIEAAEQAAIQLRSRLHTHAGDGDLLIPERR